MKEMITRVWCDGCKRDDTIYENEGSPLRIAIGDSGLHEIDLCEGCYDNLVKPLADIVAEAGQPVETAFRTRRGDVGTSKPPASGPCPECGKALATKQGLSNHRSRMHGVKVGSKVA